MHRFFRLVLAVLVLFSLGLQTIVSPGLLQIAPKMELMAEEGDSTEKAPDNTKEVLEDDDDPKNVHHHSVSILSGRACLEADRLSHLYDQYQPGSTVPPPRS